ncbi:J domain-containing protein [Ralstonia solanacearum]|uniref:J domain-containing protein n=1 Tax=Ralstonia solanacearum TaxID=305 RepID=UPI0018D0E8DD|nr:J domain-containing protein [Ralstonia solanacearum]
MTRTQHQSISIAPNQNKPALSKGQKAFNSLIKQIEKRRKRLAAWEAVTPTFQQRYINDLLPLEETSTALQTRMVRCLDQAHENKGLTKVERRKIAAMIVDLAGDLVDEDESLKAIYNKYSPTDFDSETAAEVDGMKSVLEAMLGVDLGDDLDMSSPDDLLQRAHAHVEQQAAQATAEAAQRASRRAARKKSPKQRAAEARAQEEQAQIGLSIREVYRKLASSLHPDRESDPQERDRKTKLMQRVNEAYNKNNLLQLLELQLQLEHIDQQSINSIGEERLAHYNKVLKEQVRELDQEIRHVEAAFCHAYGIAPFAAVSPDAVLRELTLDIKELHQYIRTIEQDLVAFEDIKHLKLMLKSVKLVPAASVFDSMPF